MRVAFFGTPEFAVPTLEALVASGAHVVAVITGPDRPRGRSHSTVLPSPVKLAAQLAGLPLLQPEQPRGEAFLDQLRGLNLDLGVVVAYGHLLRPDLLAIPRHGLVNVHASLLPRWRGAAPITWAIRAGDHVTGVSIMRIEPGLDTGGVWCSVETPITARDTTGTLTDRLALIGARSLVDTLPHVMAGIAPLAQDESLATHAAKVDRTTARIDWTLPARLVACHVRAMDPAPGAWTRHGELDLKLFGVRACGGEPSPAPGRFNLTGETLRVACSDGWLDIEQVQPAGRRRMRPGEWLRGQDGNHESVFR